MATTKVLTIESSKADDKPTGTKLAEFKALLDALQPLFPTLTVQSLSEVRKIIYAELVKTAKSELIAHMRTAYPTIGLDGIKEAIESFRQEVLVERPLQDRLN